MPRGAMLATTFVLGLGVASLAGAVEGTRATRGWVSSVDANGKILKVKGKNDEVTFKLEDNGKVMEKGKPSTFAELKPGEHVMVRYTGSGSDRVATEVDILAAPAAATKPSTP